MQPIELSCTQIDAQQVRVNLWLQPSLLWFQGHFAGLPGVAQIDWAIRYGCQLLATDYVFSGIERVKFQQPLLPGIRITLQLHWRPAHQLLIFSYLRGVQRSESIASSGKIQLCR